MRFLACVAVAALSACPGGPGGDECAGPADCAATDPAPCDGCLPLASELCVDGACAARGEDTVDVTIATLLIDRALDGVNGMRFAIVADTPCAEATGLGDELNALAAGQKTLSGGDLHQDLALGRIPEGTVTVVVEATPESAGQGAALAVACADGLAAQAPALEVEQITLGD